LIREVIGQPIIIPRAWLQRAGESTSRAMASLLMPGLRIELKPDDVPAIGDIAAHYISAPTGRPKLTSSGNVSGVIRATRCCPIS